MAIAPVARASRDINLVDSPILVSAVLPGLVGLFFVFLHPVKAFISFLRLPEYWVFRVNCQFSTGTQLKWTERDGRWPGANTSPLQRRVRAPGLGDVKYPR